MGPEQLKNDKRANSVAVSEVDHLSVHVLYLSDCLNLLGSKFGP